MKTTLTVCNMIVQTKQADKHFTTCELYLMIYNEKHEGNSENRKSYKKISNYSFANGVDGRGWNCKSSNLIEREENQTNYCTHT